MGIIVPGVKSTLQRLSSDRWWRSDEDLDNKSRTWLRKMRLQPYPGEEGVEMITDSKLRGIPAFCDKCGEPVTEEGSDIPLWVCMACGAEYPKWDDFASTGEKLYAALQEAEQKAWDSLSRYKFQMFGYWAAIWVHLNRLGGFGHKNPFRDAVQTAREHLGRKETPSGAS